MKVKTITAASIHAALMEARRHLGDEVVLLESIPAEGDEPARITVMADKPSRPAAPQTEKSSAPKRTAAAQTPSALPAEASRSAFGYQTAAQRKDVAVVTEESASNGTSGSGGAYDLDVGRRTVRDLIQDGDHGHGPELRRRGVSGPAGRGQLFPHRGEMSRSSNLPVPAASTEAVENLLKAQLALLHDRLDKMERRFDGAIIGAAQTWTSNPLYASLLRQGFRPGTVTTLFDKLAAKGYQPDAAEEPLKWALAQEVRRSIDLTAPKQTNGAQLFVGPSGAGKTSLLLKLAKHAGFYGRRDTAVIVIEPEEDGSRFHISPVDLFRRHGLPVQTVGTIEEMQQAIMRVQHFDHILIDTPAMPAPENAARKALRHVKRLVDPIMPLRVQFVFNATRSLDDFSPQLLRSLPLRPESAALTHLDETQGWGRIAEWLMALEMPVQFVSTSASVPDGVVSFSPTWFVEEMMKL